MKARRNFSGGGAGATSRSWSSPSLSEIPYACRRPRGSRRDAARVPFVRRYRRGDRFGLSDLPEANRLFAALAEGGKVTMPLQKQFFLGRDLRQVRRQVRYRLDDH